MTKYTQNLPAMLTLGIVIIFGMGLSPASAQSAAAATQPLVQGDSVQVAPVDSDGGEATNVQKPEVSQTEQAETEQAETEQTSTEQTETESEQVAQPSVEEVSDELLPPADNIVSPETDTAQLLNEGTEVALTKSELIMQTLSEYLPGVPFNEVSESPIPGIYEAIADGHMLYVDEAGQYIIQGEVRRLSDGANLTDEKLGRIHMSMIEAMDERDMLIYEPEEPSNRAITVFTDISCGYCRLLHEQLDTLLEEGVRVRYLMFPRAGEDSQGHKDLESVWCADNPQEAMTIAKAGGEIVARTCENPILEHMELAQRLGLRGTPLIYTDSGEKINGYREAAVLATLVKDSEPMSF